VKLSGKGWITAHTVRNAPEAGTRARYGTDAKGRETVTFTTPKNSVRLVERQPEVTESGVSTGSADASDRTRDAEIKGAAGTGEVKIVAKLHDGQICARDRDPVTGDGTWVEIECLPADAGDKLRDGAKSETVRVPGTAANIRTAMRQEMAKKQRKCKKTGEMIGGPDMALVARYGSMLRGLTGQQAIPVPGAEPGTYKVREAAAFDQASVDVVGGVGSGRDERMRTPRFDGDTGTGPVGMSPGAPMVKGRDMSCDVPSDKERTTAKGKPRNAIGWSEPASPHARVDRVAASGTLLTPDMCMMAGPDGADTCTLEGCVAVVGGRFGDRTCAEYRAMSKGQRRRYWKFVGRMRISHETRVAQRKAQRAQLTAEIERLRALGASGVQPAHLALHT
jgi:hypothetical protein